MKNKGEKPQSFIQAWIGNIDEIIETERLIQKLRTFRLFVAFRKYREEHKNERGDI